MKMRDKKIKKVNRIAKAGLALLCAGALLGGAVFGGGSVRVKANSVVESDKDSSDDASKDIRAVYYDENNEYSYILYDNSKGSELSVSNDGGNVLEKKEISSNDSENVKTNIYVIIDTRNDKEGNGLYTKDNIENSINRFENSWNNDNLLNKKAEIQGIRLPYQPDEGIKFDNIKAVLNDPKWSDSDDDSKLSGSNDDTDGQLGDVIQELTSNNKYINDNGFNIVIIITDNNSINCDTSSLSNKQVIVYKVNKEENQGDTGAQDGSHIILDFDWETLDCIKVPGHIVNENGVYKSGSSELYFEYTEISDDSTADDSAADDSTADDSTADDSTTDDSTTDDSTTDDSGKTDPYVVNKFEIENDRIIVYITNNTDEELKESDVYAFLDGEKCSIEKVYSYKKDNVSKWIVQGKFIEATATDAPNVKLKLEIKGKPLYVGVKKAGIIDRFINWFNETLSHKIILICGCLIFVVLVVFIILIVRINKKRKQGKRRRQGGIPHGSPSSSPDVQLRSGVSPTAQTNVLARRAGEQNMQGMQNMVPANNTKQIQIQIIGRNPKIINTYINGSIFVGRANTCDVFINDATISRQHFALECVNGEVFIQPLVATNGTKLNGQRINDKHPLYPNDRIQIGTIGIIVRW